MSDFLDLVRTRNPGEKEYHQAVEKVYNRIKPVLDRNPHYRQAAVLERITEPERVVSFPVCWLDDQGQVQVNRGYRIEMNSAIGPYKGALRFHPSVNQSILKFLAFEQVFKNALTTLPLGGGCGGADFEPKGKSDAEIMRFCQSFMSELYRRVGPNTDIPSPDIGVGAREIGFLFGMYKKLANQFSGALTGKGMNWGGSLVRPEAAGYGSVYLAEEILHSRNMGFADQVCLVSGSGNVAQHAAEKLIELGARVVTMSDSSGFIYDPEGIDSNKLFEIKKIKNIRRGRVQEYCEKYTQAVYTPADYTLDYNPLWDHRADCAFPCATQNEIGEKDAYNLINNNVKLVCEGASMPCSIRAIEIFMDKPILFAPSKAANAGGVAVSGLEMVQNSMRLTWTAEEVNGRLKIIMSGIHQTCLDTAEQYGTPGNLLNGAQIASFVKVADAMMDQGVT
jgi:glutamate dehydrogenase (NADP+)